MSPVETAARIVAVDGCRPAARDDFRIAAERVPPLRTTPAHVFPRQQISDPCRLAIGRIVQQGIASRLVTDQKLAARTSRQLQSGARSLRIRHPPRDGRHPVRLLRRRQHGHDRHGASRARNHAAGNDDGRSQQEQQRENQLSVNLLRESDRRGLSHRNTYRDKGSKFRNHPESREVRANRKAAATAGRVETAGDGSIRPP